jgi:uncharacterized protein YcbK (DUF882 family)
MRYFKINEFNCPHCGRNEMSKDFLERLDKAREYANTPFIISSGFRCEFHNREVGGTGTSSHLKGVAADIKVTNSKQRHKILTGLIGAGFNRIGVGNTFIHADYDKTKTQRVIWVY